MPVRDYQALVRENSCVDEHFLDRRSDAVTVGLVKWLCRSDHDGDACADGERTRIHRDMVARDLEERQSVRRRAVSTSPRVMPDRRRSIDLERDFHHQVPMGVASGTARSEPLEVIGSDAVRGSAIMNAE